jgi:hypothetical protein
LFASKYLNVGAEEKANFTAAQLTLNSSLLARLAISVGVLLIRNGTRPD